MAQSGLLAPRGSSSLVTTAGKIDRIMERAIDIGLVVLLASFSLLFLFCAIAGIIHAIEYLVADR